MIQTLQYNGLIDVKYDKVEHEVTVRIPPHRIAHSVSLFTRLCPQKALDLNKDGKLDEKDLQVAHNKVKILGESFGSMPQ